jgi:hypothetical protein
MPCIGPLPLYAELFRSHDIVRSIWLYGGVMDFDGIRISSVDDCLPIDGKYDGLYKYASKL